MPQKFHKLKTGIHPVVMAMHGVLRLVCKNKGMLVMNETPVLCVLDVVGSTLERGLVLLLL